MHPLNMSFAALWLAAALLPMMTWAADTDANLQADNPAYRWDLADLYPSPQAWTVEHDKVLAQANALDKYRDTLGRSAEDMLTALRAISDAKKESARLGTYASLKGDENVTIGVNQERVQAAQVLATTIDEKTAWLRPEILKLGPDKVHAFERQSPALARRFGFFLENALRYAPHTLGSEAESVMAAAGNVLNQPDEIYSQLSNGELPFPTVTLSDGAVRLDGSAYIKYRQATNRADRKKVFDAFWGRSRGISGHFRCDSDTQVMGENSRQNAPFSRMRWSTATLPGQHAGSRSIACWCREANKNLPTLHRYLEAAQRGCSASAAICATTISTRDVQ